MESWSFILTHSPLIPEWSHLAVTSVDECIYIPFYGGGCWVALPIHNIESAIQLGSLWGLLCWGGFALSKIPWIIPYVTTVLS